MNKFLFAVMALFMTAGVAAAGSLTVERHAVKVDGEATFVPAWFVRDNGRLVDVITADARDFTPVHGRVAVRYDPSIDNIFNGDEAGDKTGARVLLINEINDKVSPGADGILGTGDDVRTHDSLF